MIAPKQFLRRGRLIACNNSPNDCSRKEPSALNRLASNPSPRNEDRGTERKNMSKDQQRNHTGSRFRNVDNRFSTANIVASSPEGGEDDDAEILLSGSDYWRLDASITNERQPVFNSTRPLVAQQHHHAGNSLVDTMGETMNETGDWSSMRRVGNELDEFAMLEKQLEDLSAPHDGPRPHSQSQSSTKVLSAPAFPSQTSYGTQRASRPDLSRANSLGNSIRLSEQQNVSNRPESSNSKGHHHDYHDHDTRHSMRGGTYNDTDDCVDDGEEREQSFLGSTSSTNYPNSSRRLDNPFLTSYGGIDKRRQMTEDAPVSERTQRVDTSQSWGAATRPKIDADVSSDVNQECDDDIGFNGTMSATSRLSRSSINSAFPTGENKSDTAWGRDRSSNRVDNIRNGQHSDVQITHSRPVLPPRDGGRDTVRSNISHTGRNKNSNIRGGSRSGSRDRKDESRSTPGGGAGSGFASTSTNSREDPEEVRRYLSGKAKELEAELTTYRQENITLKKMKKEQEVALSEKKAEVHKWAVEERQKTEVWCEEQRQAASRERNAALKLARDSRLSGMGGAGTLGVRKERAEIEALQATLEKLRIDYDIKEKKWKANERRLQQLVKDNSASTEELQQQISNLEQNKQAIWAYLDSIGVRLPGSLIRAISNTKKEVGAHIGGNSMKTSSIGFGSTMTGNKDSSSNSQKGGPRNLYQKTGSAGRTIVGTYAVEIDPERLELSATNRQALVLREGGVDSETQRGELANAIFNTDARWNVPHYNENDGDDLGQKNSLSPKPLNFHQETRPTSSACSRGQTALSSTARISQPDNGGSGGKIALGIDSDLKSSWARSSRSSRASRYSSDDNSPMSEDEVDFGRTSAGRNEFADTIKATHSGTDRQNDKQREREDDRQVASGRDKERTRSSDLRASVNNIHTSTAEAITNTMAAVYDSNASPSKRTEEILPDGRRLISYRNGTRKEMLPTGETLVRFVNGDSKTTSTGSSGVVVYYYAQADTTHTTYKDGLEVYEFPNKQVEKHFPDGTKEILFPDSTRKLIYSDGVQESFFPDGVIVKEYADGTRDISRAIS